MSGSPRPGRDTRVLRHGWTLIELLLAVTIALLVMTLLLSAYHTVLTATRGQGTRRQHDEAARALNQLSRELQAAFLPEKDTNCVLRLVNAGGIQLEWCATLLGAQENDLRWFDVTRIRYRTVTNGTDVTLLREAQPLIGPEALRPPVASEQIHHVRDLHITLFDGAQWQSTWPVSDPPSLPRAARIELHSGSSTHPVHTTTEIFFPAASGVAPLPR